ncbi:MAG: hypothetical protein N2111_01445 [Candidatus Sumerlaeaceae bacterium]|nr:hypothetical protein [Candidatus Sumerlaeaceae bacterium]
MAISIEFGRPEWQSHLGGDLYPPEHDGDLWWRWCGSGIFWCVLPKETPSGPVKIRLEAAPLAPFSGPIMELLLTDQTGKTLARRVSSTGCVAAQTDLVCVPTTHCAAAWRLIPPPGITVTMGQEIVARLGYETRPEVQVRDFEIPEGPEDRAALRIISFQASPAIAATELGTSDDRRPLAFRLFRLILL